MISQQFNVPQFRPKNRAEVYPQRRINFTQACGICEVPTALQKILFNGKDPKKFKQRSRVITLNVAHHNI